MEASTGPPSLPTPPAPSQPNLDKLSLKLLEDGIHPTPKIMHRLRKKELQKSNRQISKQPPPTQQHALSEDSYFQTIKSEYKNFKRAMKSPNNGQKIVGMPWEKLDKFKLRELATENTVYSGESLKSEHLRELSDIIKSERDKFTWVLDDDIELKDDWFSDGTKKRAPTKSQRSEVEEIQFLINRLSGMELSAKDWRFSRLMKHSGLQFTERQMLRIVEHLGEKGQWRHAVSVVEWVYNSKEHRYFKSRFVYTKLLAVLGKARRATEALQVYKYMRGDSHIYPDMAAYHSIAVTLGQAGLLKELVNVIDRMKERPKKFTNMKHKNWDPILQPDLVVFNAVLNACAQSCQWRGVSWVFQQLRKSGLKPNGATYGLAMEVMLQSGKYNLVHELFRKMISSGEALRAITYRVLVKAFWKQGKVNEAVQAVRDMERRGIVGTPCVHYELACCLCYYGRWQEAIVEIEKLKKFRRRRPLEFAFTGMILSSLDGGHVSACHSLFEHSRNHCAPDIGIINAMLKVYSQNDMFLKARELFEKIKNCNPSIDINGNESSLSPDVYTYSSMLEASARALQWEYFDYVYKTMALCGFRLDQRKHASLLVEASRAGKWHLLEHAFDALLEAGEIPQQSFFSEMVCQALAQNDHERALTIINTTAHAPFQISKQQWIKLFEENGDRISCSTLKELLNTLGRHDLSGEGTVVNLRRALGHCDSCNDRGLRSSISPGVATIVASPADSYTGVSSSDRIVNRLHLSASTLLSFAGERDEHSDLDSESRLPDSSYSRDIGSKSITQLEDDLTYDFSPERLDGGSASINVSDLEDDIDDSDPEMLVTEDDDSNGNCVPSALEILDKWKVRTDGVLFTPFQYNQK